MSDPLDSIPVNLFRGSTDSKPAAVLTLTEALDAIQHGAYQGRVQWLRALFQAGRKAAYDRAKRRLEAVTFGGTFHPTRGKANLTLHSGLVHGDVDHLDDVEAAKRILAADPHVVDLFTSPSGEGLKVDVLVEPVNSDEAYKHAWQAVADAHAQQYGLTWDPSGKDISRLCYLSWDPALYRNPHAQVFPVPPYAPPPPKPPPSPPAKFAIPCNRCERYAQQAIQTAAAMIDASTPGNRHFARRKAAELLGGYIAGGIVTEADAYAALEQAVKRNTDDLKRSMKTIADGLSHGQARPITLEALEAERQAWIEAHCSTTSRRHVPALSDPWEGMLTLPIRPYTGYRGLRYGKVVCHG
jgi:hypothetical protein